MHSDEFRVHAHRFVDWMADYFAGVENYPLVPACKPGDLLKMLPEKAPEFPEPMEDIFRDFTEMIMPGITHWQHPGWFAYFPANNSPASVLAEMLTATLGVQGMLWQTSPAATELEERMMQWLGQMIGLPPAMQGVIQDTASTATLCALISAREKLSGGAVNRSGFYEKMTVYASEEAHSSIEKGVKIAGFGSDNLRRIATNESFAMRVELLENSIQQDIQNGFKPCCVVACLGTTSSMAMDPLVPLAEICRKYGLWLHVDAAMAGTAALVPEFREFMKGIDEADSLVFNPHKWMGVNFDCSAYFVRNAKDLTAAFDIRPEYLKTGADEQVKNYRDWGIQLGRRFRALKLWFVIRSYGQQGLSEMIQRHIALAAGFAERVAAHPELELLAPRQLSLVCFRFKGGLADDGKKAVSAAENDLTAKEETRRLNEINRSWLERINESREVFLTHTMLQGRYCIRMSVGQRTSEQTHIDRLWNRMLETLPGSE